MSFKVGDKVICINAHGRRCIKEGKIYTIDRISIDLPLGFGFKEIPYYFLEKPPHSRYGYLDAKRFKKLDDSWADGVLNKIKKSVEDLSFEEQLEVFKLEQIL